MRRGIIFLVLWLITVVVLAGVFVSVIPPGGVSWPYYLFVACTPIGALLYARFPGKLLIAACYGLLAGAWFALPIFDDERRVVAGDTTVESVALKVSLVALAMSLLCAGAFMVGQRFFRRDETRAV